jgi:hypothetical protein
MIFPKGKEVNQCSKSKRKTHEKGGCINNAEISCGLTGEKVRIRVHRNLF